MGSRGEVVATLQQMAATPHPVKVGDKEYLLSPLRLLELAELEAWASRQPYEQLKEKAELLKKAGFGQEHVMELLREADANSNDPAKRSSAMASVAGIKRALLLGFKIRHPEMDEKALDLILAENSMDALKAIMDAHISSPEIDKKK